jgi:hypothetical protein
MIPQRWLHPLYRLLSTGFLLLGLNQFASATPIQSAMQWYQIEMIIFSQIPFGELQNETWPIVPAFVAPQKIFNLVPSQVYQTQTLSNYPLVLPQDFILNTQASHLMNNPHYKIIAHLAWLQPVSSESTSKIPPTYIQASRNPCTMDALLQLKQDKFIQLTLQSVLSINDDAFTNTLKQLKLLDSDGVIRFDVNQSIRMKTNELNYIDSPFVGILIEIIPHFAPNP